jgi:hypothetical protein
VRRQHLKAGCGDFYKTLRHPDFFKKQKIFFKKFDLGVAIIKSLHIIALEKFSPNCNSNVQLFTEN